MKSKLSLVLFLIAIVLIVHSTAADPVKSREKRSPKPQLGKLIGTFIARWAPQVVKQVPKVVKLARQVGNWVNKNPGTSAAGAVVGVGVIAGAQSGQKQCVVYIRSLPELQPVFIKDGTPRSLLLPKDGYLTWAHGETSTIACPGNYIEATYSTVETITCDNGFMFKLDNGLVDIRTITCHQKVTGDYQNKTDPQCAGTNRAVGFNVWSPTGNKFFDLFYSCFDDARASVLFAHHVIFGSEIDHKCIYTSSRPRFKVSGFPIGFAPSSTYTQTNQSARLADLFTVPPVNRNVAQSDADRYFNRAGYLQRGHLTPDADELFTTWQWSTYFYINVAPMWDPINTGNWKHLETKVRKLANETKENLEIYTGTYGTLQLCSTTNYCPDFTLENGGIPVPAWLWKIVKSPTEDAAIALVVSNNPFNAVNPICGSRQQDFGWHQNGFDSFQNGTVSYCTVQDLKNVVRYVPQAAMATHILAF